MSSGPGVRSRTALSRWASDRALPVCLILAAAGAAGLVLSHFVASRWVFWLGFICVLPLLLWLVALLCFAVPVLVVLRGFSTRRDDGSPPDENIPS